MSGAGWGRADAPFSEEECAEEHVDDHAAGAKDDVDGHGYVVCEGGVVEDGEGEEEGDLEEVGEEGHSAGSEGAGGPGELGGECVEGDGEELKEGDEDASVWVRGGELFCCDRIAVSNEVIASDLIVFWTYLQHPPKRMARV